MYHPQSARVVCTNCGMIFKGLHGEEKVEALAKWALECMATHPVTITVDTAKMES